MHTKICGITQLKDAEQAIAAGAWALGFNFYQKSPRAVTALQAKNIIEQLPKNILKVGIFIEQSADELQAIMKQTNLDLAQVYHHDYPDHLKKQMIFCHQPSDSNDCPPHHLLKSYAFILIDAPRGKKCAYGGTGNLANWEVAKNLANDFKIILAGGLHPNNVGDAITQVKPFAVDVASGVESSPGIKNPKLLNQFVKEVKYAT